MTTETRRPARPRKHPPTAPPALSREQILAAIETELRLICARAVTETMHDLTYARETDPARLRSLAGSLLLDHVDVATEALDGFEAEMEPAPAGKRDWRNPVRS